MLQQFLLFAAFWQRGWSTFGSSSSATNEISLLKNKNRKFPFEFVARFIQISLIQKESFWMTQGPENILVWKPSLCSFVCLLWYAAFFWAFEIGECFWKFVEKWNFTRESPQSALLYSESDFAPIYLKEPFQNGDMQSKSNSSANSS